MTVGRDSVGWAVAGVVVVVVTMAVGSHLALLFFLQLFSEKKATSLLFQLLATVWPVMVLSVLEMLLHACHAPVHVAIAMRTEI